MFPKIIMVFAAVTFSSANIFAPIPYAATPFLFPQAAMDYYALPKYDSYSYVVPDKAPTEQTLTPESRDVEVIKGTYSLQESDGTVRSVHYTSDDKNGFSAVVSRSNQGINPQTFAKALLSTPLNAAPSAHTARMGIGFPTYHHY